MSGERLRVIDTGPVQVVYADDIASAEIVGQNVRILFVETKTIDGERLWVPSIEMIRPLQSCLRLTLRDLLQSQIVQLKEPVVPMTCVQ